MSAVDYSGRRASQQRRLPAIVRNERRSQSARKIETSCFNAATLRRTPAQPIQEEPPDGLLTDARAATEGLMSKLQVMRGTQARTWSWLTSTLRLYGRT